MAPFATIYTYPNNMRVQRAQAVAKMNGLEVVEDNDFQLGNASDPKWASILSKFPFGKVPALSTSDGTLNLTEGQAIVRFLAESGPKADQLLGRTVVDRARIEQWACFAEQELMANLTPPMLMVYRPDLVPYAKEGYDTFAAKFERAVKYVETVLTKGNGKFLVGEEVTVADVMVAGPLILASKLLLDAEMKKNSAPSVEGYLRGLLEVPELKEAFGELVTVQERVRGKTA
ncbi:glutathione S-transferase [Pseudoneurospora amorphoporcata]|uniref:Glutathione S-transferase n=1 Tax=Pseudoneurospora amorphoporcata TaxID=241081 RepID=A0AAN6NQ45_9PEZI|nr:glutathione S-transferase [Pseudoneurospora amorphoporcata]